MKHLGLVQFILLLGVGLLLLGPAAAELTAYQNLMPSAEVGQMVTVTVSLTYNGQNSIQAVVTPSPPPGVVANAGGQSIELYPGVTQQVSYPLAAQQSGTYWIVSEISYAEYGAWRNLRLEAPFTAIAPVVPQPQPTPGETTPHVEPDGSNPMGTDPFPMPPGGALPGGALPGGVLPGGVSPNNSQPTQPDNGGAPGGEPPEDVPQEDGFNPEPDQGERPHGVQ
ncbi:MAG: hypothetical protein JW999_03685 [Methanotrichaceae archaeon]|nr:hypothetical protein [Methanotrichaceae archaeon]